jgi:arylsulfatase
VEQKPLDGTSLVYTFDDAEVPTQHSTQYFELVGNRAIYKDGWMASTTPLRLPWVTIGDEPSPDDYQWELYNINEDFSQANNLAAQNPEKLKELQAAFDAEAKKYNVYPLDSSFASRADPSIRPSLTTGRTEFAYFPGMIRIPEGSAPDFKNKSWTIAAEVTIPEDGAEGVLATIGGRFGGWALMLRDDKPEFVYALSNQPQHKYRVASDQALPAGEHVVRFKFDYEGGGIGKGATGTLLLNERQVAKAHIPRTVGVRFSLDETYDVGEDAGTPVVEDYADAMPFEFTGTLKRLAVVLEPDNLSPEEKERLRKEMAKALMNTH